MTRSGELEQVTIRHIVRILNRIIDKGMIVGSDTCGICTDKDGRYAIDVALRNRLLRWHYVKQVSTHSASYRKTRKVYTVTRRGIRFLMINGGV